MLSSRFNPSLLCLAASAIALIPASLQAGIELPGGGTLEKVDFERHVMGLFGKAGCNNGSCHGSFQGKNGFWLSLFGYEPERDFAALTRELLNWQPTHPGLIADLDEGHYFKD